MIGSRVKLCTVEMGVHAWQAWRASWCAAAMGVAGRWERRGSIGSIAIAMVSYSHRAWHAHRRGYAVNIDFHHSETTEAQNDFAAGRRQHDDRGMLIFVMRSSRRRESLEPGGHQGGI